MAEDSSNSGSPAAAFSPLQLADSLSSHMNNSNSNNNTPKSPFIARLMSTTKPLASPVKKAVSGVRVYLEEVGHLTKLHPHEAWLPITESRSGNAYYAAFHTLSSGIGVQALLLPLAFTDLGWAWGVISLCVAFAWQLYTLWVLIQLHESVPGAPRYSRYLQLSMAAFGEKLGKVLALFPTMYLSGGTCVALIVIGGGTMKIFYQIVSEKSSSDINIINHSLTTVEWYLVFVCSAVVLAQLPNLNSIAGVSLVGAITAVSYCTMIWVTSIHEHKPMNHQLSRKDYRKDYESDIARVSSVFNALGIIAFAFRGHNLVLEIQGTMPSTQKNPSRVAMWGGVKFSYLIIALCLFPLAVVGYWAYGNLIPANGGILGALYKHHGNDTSKVILGLISLLVVANCLTSFQIYAMPVFDNLELRYTSRRNRGCPWWVRAGLRVLFGCLAFFIAVALPFLQSLAGLIGGIALPLTLAYPCFMWIAIKAPERFSFCWCLNGVLGCVGIILSVLLVTGAVWSLITQGLEVHFFRPQ